MFVECKAFVPYDPEEFEFFGFLDSFAVYGQPVVEVVMYCSVECYSNGFLPNRTEGLFAPEIFWNNARIKRLRPAQRLPLPLTSYSVASVA